MYYGFCAGRLPFNDPNIQRLLQKVCAGRYSVPLAQRPIGRVGAGRGGGAGDASPHPDPTDFAHFIS